MLRRWATPVIVAAFVMAGDYKGAAVLARLPVDLTLALAVIVLALCGWRIIRAMRLPLALGGVLIGFIVLVPAALLAPHTTYATVKVERFFTLTLLAACAPVLLIQGISDVRRFVWSWAFVCLAVASVAIMFPQHASPSVGAQLTGIGSNTIALGRSAGLVIVVVVLAVMWRQLRLLLALPMLGIATYSLLQSGSRGPLVAAALALAAVLTLAPRRPRLIRVLGLVAVVGFGAYYAFHAAPEDSQQRLIGLLSGQLDTSATTRIQLYHLAWHQTLIAPLGSGLGSFATIAPTGFFYPHDIGLEVLSEAGLVFGGAFIAWLAWRLLRARRLAFGFTGSAIFGILTFTLVNAIVSGDLNDNRTLFFAIGLSAATAAVYPATARALRLAKRAPVEARPMDTVPVLHVPSD